jgi:hypothetical protein
MSFSSIAMSLSSDVATLDVFTGTCFTCFGVVVVVVVLIVDCDTNGLVLLLLLTL